MTDSIPCGYDRATDTVRVSRHDLYRLLLQFRTELEQRRDGDGPHWAHMVDYDKSFERLADAIDEANKHLPWHEADRGPDYRMRCKRTPVYIWPDHAPYDGRPVDAVRIKDRQTKRDHGSHYVTGECGSATKTLCGFGFDRGEAKLVSGAPACPECVREHALAAAAGTGER